MTNNKLSSDLGRALAYARDMEGRGVYSDPTSQSTFLSQLKHAGADLFGDHHMLFPLDTLLHHYNLMQATPSVAYSARVFTLGIYSTTQINQSVTTMTTKMNGAIVRIKARVTREMYKTSVFKVAFNHFDAVAIPANGVWVLAVAHPHQKDQVEYYTNSYSITQTERTTISAAPDHQALVPLAITHGNHTHRLSSMGLSFPRLLLRVRDTSNLELIGAAVELNFNRSSRVQLMQSELGATTQSLQIGAMPDDLLNAVHGSVSDEIEKNRIYGCAGWVGNNDTDIQIGTDANAKPIVSKSMGVLVLSMAIQKVYTENFDTIAKMLDQYNPDWHSAGDTKEVALPLATGSTEAFIAAMSVDGGDSPIISHLQRIFGRGNVPPLKVMMSGIGTGLPSSVMRATSPQQLFDRILTPDINNTRRADELVVEDLSYVKEPEWTLNKSPLAFAMLLSVMPANFKDTARIVMNVDMGMKTARLLDLEHGSCMPEWTHISVEATMSDLKRAAAYLAKTQPMAIEPVVVGDRVPLGGEHEAKDLFFCGSSFAGKVAYTQSDAAKESDPKRKLSFDATQMHEILCIKDTTTSGESIAMLLNRSSGTFVVLRFAIDMKSVDAMKRRDIFLRAVVGAMARHLPRGSEAVVAQMEKLSNYAVELQNRGRASSSRTYHIHVDKLPLLAQMKGFKLYPVTGPIDAGAIVITDVTDVGAELRHEGQSGIVTNLKVTTATSGDTNVIPANLKLVSGNSSLTIPSLSVGSHLFIDSCLCESVTAAQNLNLSKTETVGHDPFGISSLPKLSNPSSVNSVGVRAQMIRDQSALVQGKLGSSGTRGMIMSCAERKHMPTFYSGIGLSVNDWSSPFA